MFVHVLRAVRLAIVPMTVGLALAPPTVHAAPGNPTAGVPAAPNLAAPAAGPTAPPDPAAVAEGTALGERIAACFEREDPACAAPLVAELEKLAPTSATTAYCRGVMDFLTGRLEPARTALQRAAGSPLAPAGLRERAQAYLELVDSTIEVHAGSQARPVAGGRAIVHIRPGPDEVLLPYLDRVLTRALPRLEAAFGSIGTAPIAVHVYPKVEDLGRVSGLTPEQIRTSGTIALCKHNRMMITSPADLVFGYPWADTIVHELVHHVIIRRGGPKVPVWLHEGLARAFQGIWRDAAPGDLDREEKRVLLSARRRNRFIPLAKMSPSLALLPSQDDTQLAFAEVHHAVSWLLAQATAQDTGPRGAAVFTAHAGRLVALFAEGLGEAEVLQRWANLSPGAFAGTWRRDLARLELGSAADDGPQPRPQPLVFRGAGLGPGGLRDLGEQSRQYAELGDRLSVLKRPLAAAIEYRKAIAASTDQGGPLLTARLARVLLDLGKTAEAIEYLMPALEDWPDHAPLHILAGRAHASAGRYREALDALDAAAWINPYDPQLHALAAQAHTALGQPGDAAAARTREHQVGSLAP